MRAPICPVVRSTWHAFKMRHLSSLPQTYLTSNTSYLIEVINACMMRMPYRAECLYTFCPVEFFFFFFFFFCSDLSISQSKCCSLSSDVSFFVARLPPINQVKNAFSTRSNSFPSAHISLAVSDAVTRAFTLINACASCRTVCGGADPYFVRPDQIWTRCHRKFGR